MLVLEMNTTLFPLRKFVVEQLKRGGFMLSNWEQVELYCSHRKIQPDWNTIAGFGDGQKVTVIPTKTSKKRKKKRQS